MICPICKEEFSNRAETIIHIEKNKDKQHKLLNILCKQSYNGMPNIEKLYNDNLDMFEIEIEPSVSVEKTLAVKKRGRPSKNNNESPQIKVKKNKLEDDIDIAKIEDGIVRATCGIETTCEECYKYNNSRFSRCKKYAKRLQTSIFREFLVNNPIVVNDEVDINPERDKEKEKPAVIYGMAKALVDYFYRKLNITTEPPFEKEVPQVCNLLTRFTPDEIKLTMQLLIEKGCINLSFLNNTIGEAIMVYKCLKEKDTEGTPSYLVNLHYNYFNTPMIKGTFVKDVHRLTYLMKNGLSYNNAKVTINYMIKNNCRVFAFINNKVAEISKLQENKSSNHNGNSNDYNDINLIILKLKQVKMSFKTIEQEIKDQIYQELINIYFNKEYNEQYSPLEWAFRIGLPLTQEMFKHGYIEQKNRISIFDMWLDNESINNDKIEKIKEMKKRFEQWVEQGEQQYNS